MQKRERRPSASNPLLGKLTEGGLKGTGKKYQGINATSRICMRDNVSRATFALVAFAR